MFLNASLYGMALVKDEVKRRTGILPKMDPAKQM
jgi:hypothetical protein